MWTKLFQYDRRSVKVNLQNGGGAGLRRGYACRMNDPFNHPERGGFMYQILDGLAGADINLRGFDCKTGITQYLRGASTVCCVQIGQLHRLALANPSCDGLAYRTCTNNNHNLFHSNSHSVKKWMR